MVRELDTFTGIYAKKDFPSDPMSFAPENNQSVCGIGSGIGHVFVFLDIKLQQEMITKAYMDSECAIGLDIGIGDAFIYLSKDLQKEIFIHLQHKDLF
jgi:hypothetical protein